MLTRYQIESELSLAYLHAVAAKASFAIDIPHIDSDSIDAVISAKGYIAPPPAKRSPRIEVQLKATRNAVINGAGNIAFPLLTKNYDDLRAETVLPRLLVLLALPANDADWLIHHPDRLVLQKCCYYLNLKGLPDRVGIAQPTVYVPAANMLTPDKLRDLMVKAAKLEDL